MYATSQEFYQILVWSEGSQVDPKKMNSSILINPLNLFVSVTEDIYIYNGYNDNKTYSGLDTININKSLTSRDCSYNPYFWLFYTCIEYRYSNHCSCGYCSYYVYSFWPFSYSDKGPEYSPDNKRCNGGSRAPRSTDDSGATNRGTNSNSNNNQIPITVNHGQVYKLSSNASNSTIVMSINGSCSGLFVINNTIYCSMNDHHQVVKKPLQSSNSTLTIVAGNGSRGSTSNMLNGSQGIFVDTDFHLYVADSGNHRIQRFRLNESHGETVAGNESDETMRLSWPTGVALDADGSLFIVDSGNHRIVESRRNGFRLRCIVGCSNSSGSASDKLSSPWSLSFDSYGNIFVSDWGNNRIQKFNLKTNSCGKSKLLIIDAVLKNLYAILRKYIAIYQRTVHSQSM